MKSILQYSLFLLSFAFSSFAQAAADDSTYVIRPNDTISLLVYEEPDLSVQVNVLQTGQASFPLIGSVEVGGLSVDAAATKITELYAKDYLVEPRVTLTVDKYATDYISVIGAVKQPGQIPIPLSGDLDLGSAVASAGGIIENADQNNIQLVRAAGGTTTYSLAQIQGSAGRTKLKSGDRVIVNESQYVNRFVRVLGKVNKAGAIPFPIDGRLDLVSAIAMAGGMNEMANQKKVRITRGSTVKEINFNDYSREGAKPYYLQPDDIITVPERIF